jgi:hypothetical protein
MENLTNNNQEPQSEENILHEETSITDSVHEIETETNSDPESQELTTSNAIQDKEEITINPEVPVEIAGVETLQTEEIQTEPIDESLHDEVKVSESVDESPVMEGEKTVIEFSEELHEFKVEQADDDFAEQVAEQEVEESEENFDSFTREHLVDLLEKAVVETDISSVKNRIALIKVAYLKKKKEENLQKYEKIAEEGEVKEEIAIAEDPLDIRFNEFFAIYKTNKARYSEEQEKLKLENLKKKKQILDELRVLVNSEETLKKTYDEFKTLQERWKGIGMVPRAEINDLWQNYHFLVEKFFDKVKLNKELKDLDLKKNLEAKIALCEKTEELLLETSLLKSFKKLQKYHEEWKELGPVIADKKDEIWERFKNASDKINEHRREHYVKVEEEQKKNLETKIALCDQAEEVLGLNNETIKDWQENTNKINELLKIWKSIGPVPQKFNVETWNRFKTSLDGFFSVKKEFFDKLKDQQIHNYNLKVELCLQAEGSKTSTDWKKTTNDLIRLQNEWKKIGPVPKKHSDKIWKRFRTACDEFFTAKSAYFSTLQSSEEENLTKKRDLLQRIKDYQFGEDKNGNLEVLKGFQREWTEIGHIPIKEKDKLQNEFRQIINEHFDRLKINPVEISTLSYQNHIESLKHDPQAKRLIGKEREILSGKINKMKEDINLWENNIGFLANSKNAVLLKEEFVKKIDKAKGEVKVMEAKLKLLKSE